MTREEIDEVRALAKERGQVLLTIRVNGRYCRPPSGSYEFVGPVSNEVCGMIGSLLRRLVEEEKV